jgi:hypothetical protein
MPIMRGLEYLTAALLSASMLFAIAAQAVEIPQYDTMAIPDQGSYVALLIQGAEKTLTDERRPDLAAQVEKVFSTTLPGDQHTLGMVEFERNLARARVVDADGLLKDPKALRIEVEDAMALLHLRRQL